jgi:predicted transcriptional regulator of viral defense system
MYSIGDMMNKTIGAQAARVIAALYDSGKAVFRLSDVETITGQSPAAARSFVRKLVGRGVATRVKPGLYVLVPSELGTEKTYLGNPYVLAREIIHPHDYYVSHGSAMEIHRMTTHPQLAVTISTPAVRRPVWVHGTEYRFVRWRADRAFGVESMWVTKQDAVRVSNVERTIIDGLDKPRYCGGVVEVASGLWRRRGDVDLPRLSAYAVELGVGAVCKRLGFVLDLLELGDSAVLDPLRERSAGSHVLLDPVLPPEGSYNGRWRVRVNVDPREIISVLGA